MRSLLTVVALLLFAGCFREIGRDDDRFPDPWVPEPRPFDAGWRGAANKSRRVVSSLFALGVLIFASTSIWEGIAFSNPVFRLSRVWVDSLGVSPWLSGGVWLLLGTMGALLGLKLQRGRGLLLLQTNAIILISPRRCQAAQR